MPTPRPLTPKRPKLSLQTSTISILPTSNRTAIDTFSSAVDTQTTLRSAIDIASEHPPPTPASANPHEDEAFNQLRQPERPSPHTASSSSSVSTLSSGPSSPFANTAPYTLTMGARSILRNSPLPKRHLANLPNRPPKRMFLPMKRVSFPERLVEMIPSPLLSDSDIDTIGNIQVDSNSSTETTAAMDLPCSNKGDGIPTRRKRRSRDWIWRPVDDESVTTQLNETRTSFTEEVLSAEWLPLSSVSTAGECKDSVIPA
ncbi:MAG: hypothetical protein Q9219_007298 [cf. Caloplaca sp. 3 TL-2023]